MLKIHFSNNLSKHFVNVRTMFSTCFYKGTAPYLSQGLEEKKGKYYNTYYTSGGTIIHFILGVRFTDTLWRKSAIKEVNDWVHYISFFPKKSFAHVYKFLIIATSLPSICQTMFQRKLESPSCHFWFFTFRLLLHSSK